MGNAKWRHRFKLFTVCVQPVQRSCWQLTGWDDDNDMRNAYASSIEWPYYRFPIVSVMLAKEVVL